jgi:2-dehydro-3-deoxyphosphooctonate aldolase (KDO 8-P synthase)
MVIGSHDLSKGLFFISGPCLVEGGEMMRRVAGALAEIAARDGVEIILKGSFRKANRTSGDSFSSIGDEAALVMLAQAGEEAGLPTLTDIHLPQEATMAANYVDCLQIPAFLSRQTDLIQAAARTGCAVNIKKGQFLAPEDMAHAVAKARAEGNDRVMVCERGTTFGYHNLVVDMRSLLIMRQSGATVVYDATHSLQLPSQGSTSGGQSEYALPLARAAVAVGVDGVFFETHPDPSHALSDQATQIPLLRAGEFVRHCLAVDSLVRSNELNGESHRTTELPASNKLP